MNAAATRRLAGLNAHLSPTPSAGVLKWLSNLFGGGSEEEEDHGHGHGHGDDDHSHGHGHGEEERRPPAPDGSPRTGEKNDGELSFERALSAFEDKDAGWYDIIEKNGISLIYKAMEFAEFEEKISDIDRSGTDPTSKPAAGFSRGAFGWQRAGRASMRWRTAS